MTMGFRSGPEGGVAVDLDRDEAAVLRSMAGLVLELVEPPEPKDDLARFVGIGDNGEKPDDPVLARLFPDAYTEDTESAGDFRRYTEDGLRRQKRDNAEAVLAAVPETGGRVELGPEEAHVWLKSLNDVRLALGTRLGVDEEVLEARLRGESVENDMDESSAAALNIYDWLTGLQETLVQALR